MDLLRCLAVAFAAALHGGLCGGVCGGVCWLFELVVNVGQVRVHLLVCNVSFKRFLKCGTRCQFCVVKGLQGIASEIAHKVNALWCRIALDGLFRVEIHSGDFQ